MTILYFETTLNISLDHGGEIEAHVVITYEVTPARVASAMEPGHGDTVVVKWIDVFSAPGVKRLMPHWLTDWVERDDLLRGAMLDHWREERARRADDATDDRREDRLMLARAT